MVFRSVQLRKAEFFRLWMYIREAASKECRHLSCQNSWSPALDINNLDGGPPIPSKKGMPKLANARQAVLLFSLYQLGFDVPKVR
jgi:hypothetical protein